jgi:DNA-directed RNA polymerase subunit RPC12/RpoP
MSIIFVCESCGKTLEMQEFLAGQQVECYHCHRPLVVPQEDQPTIIDFACLGCGTKYRVPASRAGARTKCTECGAVLEIPGGETPPPIYQLQGQALPIQPTPGEETSEGSLLDDLPPPVPRRPMPGGRAARTGGAHGPDVPVAPHQQARPGDEMAYVAPPKKGASPGMVILWVCLGVFALLAVVLILAKPGSRTPTQTPEDAYERLWAKSIYNSAADVWVITNTMEENWSNVTFTLHAGGQTFTQSMDALASKQAATLYGDRFVSGAGVKFDTSMPIADLTITCRLPGGKVAKAVITPGRPKEE